MEAELNSNEKVAKTIMAKLLVGKLINDGEVVVEKKIANGTIKENDWKVLFESKIRELKGEVKNEVK
jgi:hypothetical protein